MTKPLVNMRPDPVLIKAAREKGLDLKDLLEKAIAENLEKCPHCGAKLKPKAL